MTKEKLLKEKEQDQKNTNKEQTVVNKDKSRKYTDKENY